MISDFLQYFKPKKDYKDECEEFIYYIDEVLFDLKIETEKINKLMHNNINKNIIKVKYKELRFLNKELILAKLSIFEKRKKLNNVSQISYNSNITRIRNINDDLSSIHTDIQLALLENNKIRNYIKYL